MPEPQVVTIGAEDLFRPPEACGKRLMRNEAPDSGSIKSPKEY